MPHIAGDSADVEAILAEHWAWFETNKGLDVENMVGHFADPGYLQYSLNGHIYRSVHEKARVWNALRAQGFDFGELAVLEQPQVHVDRDLAYLTVVWSSRISGDAGTGTLEPTSEAMVIRATEIYRRDDGRGNPVWKIWHFHASAGAPDGDGAPSDGAPSNGAERDGDEGSGGSDDRDR